MLAEGGEIWIGKGFVLDGKIVEALGMTDEVDCWYDSVFIRQYCWLRVHVVHLDRVCWCCFVCCVVVWSCCCVGKGFLDGTWEMIVFLGRGTCLAGSGLGVCLQSLLAMGQLGVLSSRGCESHSDILFRARLAPALTRDVNQDSGKLRVGTSDSTASQLRSLPCILGGPRRLEWGLFQGRERLRLLCGLSTTQRCRSEMKLEHLLSPA